MKFRALFPMSLDDLEAGVISEDAVIVCESLLSASLHGPDRRWAEQACLRALSSKNVDVRSAALTGLCHVARLQGITDQRALDAKLAMLQGDSALEGLISDLRDDIAKFSQAHTASNRTDLERPYGMNG